MRWVTQIWPIWKSGIVLSLFLNIFWFFFSNSVSPKKAGTARKRAAPVVESEASDDSDRSVMLFITFSMCVDAYPVSNSSFDKPSLGSPANIQPSPKKKAKAAQASPSLADVDMGSEMFVLILFWVFNFLTCYPAVRLMTTVIAHRWPQVRLRSLGLSRWLSRQMLCLANWTKLAGNLSPLQRIIESKAMKLLLLSLKSSLICSRSLFLFFYIYRSNHFHCSA